MSLYVFLLCLSNCHSAADILFTPRYFSLNFTHFLSLYISSLIYYDYLPRTFNLITEFNVRPHLKSTRQRYSPPSLSWTGSIVSIACGRTDKLKLARSPKVSLDKCLARSR